MKNKDGEVKYESDEIVNIIEEHYKDLYSSIAPEPENANTQCKVMNVGSEEIPDLNSTKIEEALSQLKNGRAPGEYKITSEMIKLGVTTTMESMKILMNKCLHIGNIPRTWQNAQVTLLHKKGDKLNLSKFRPISLLPLTKILTNRLTRKLDEYQSSDQAGFRKGHSTVEHLQTLRTLLEKCNEYNTPLHLAFIDFNRLLILLSFGQ